MTKFVAINPAGTEEKEKTVYLGLETRGHDVVLRVYKSDGSQAVSGAVLRLNEDGIYLFRGLADYGIARGKFNKVNVKDEK